MKRNFDKVIAHTKKWEGGLSRDANDTASKGACPTAFKGKKGWHTNAGITYTTWKGKFGTGNDARFFAMSAEDWLAFYMKYYNAVKGDSVVSDSISFLLTQIAWGSGIGSGQAGKTAQKALNRLGAKLVVDGVIGAKTIEAINGADERKLFDLMIEERGAFFKRIAKGSQATFLRGWMNRLKDFEVSFRPE